MLRPSSSATAYAARAVRGVQAPRVRTRSFTLLAALVTALTMSLTVPTSAHALAPAAPKAAAKKTDTTAAKKAAPGKTAGKTAGKSGGSPSGNKSISLDDDFLVEGKLEKPSAFYVLRRSATDYDWARLDAVFTPLVLESVQDPLF